MHITYLFDPLCGWCYGAGPAIERLSGLEGVTLEAIPTGLFAGEGARPMDQGFAAFAWQNDQRIARLTGREFSEAYRTHVLGAEGERLDSGPAILGFVAVSLSEPGRELAALKALQNARYEDGRNNTSLDAVADILKDAGFAEAAKRVREPDQELVAAAARRIEAARATLEKLGTHGVPTLVVDDGSGAPRLLPSAALYGSPDNLTDALRAA